MIEWSGSLGRDYKRALRTYGDILNNYFADVLWALMADEALPPNLHDHNLIGQWKNCRECHVGPDLLLIYEKYETEDESVLFLMRLGSHSELFGKMTRRSVTPIK
jgi:mRNA interferase YafQ